MAEKDRVEAELRAELRAARVEAETWAELRALHIGALRKKFPEERETARKAAQKELSGVRGAAPRRAARGARAVPVAVGPCASPATGCLQRGTHSSSTRAGDAV